MKNQLILGEVRWSSWKTSKRCFYFKQPVSGALCCPSAPGVVNLPPHEESIISRDSQPSGHFVVCHWDFRACFTYLSFSCCPCLRPLKRGQRPLGLRSRWWEKFPGEKRRLSFRRRTSTSRCLWTLKCRWWIRSTSLRSGAREWSLCPSASGTSCSLFRPNPLRPASRMFPWRLRVSGQRCKSRWRGAFWERVKPGLSSSWARAQPANPRGITFILSMASVCVEPSARWVSGKKGPQRIKNGIMLILIFCSCPRWLTSKKKRQLCFASLVGYSGLRTPMTTSKAVNMSFICQALLQ